MERKPETILATAESISKLRVVLERKTAGLGIMFVDLVGSTELKYTMQQEEWLPLVARFLLTVSGVVAENGGEVVKYIGDEVMAVFQQRGVHLAVVKMEACVWGVEETLKTMTPPILAKYSLDYGSAAEIDFDNFPRDYLGTVVDRCARIARLAKRGTAVASGAYVAESKNHRSWRRVGKTDLRGFPSKETIYQLDGLGDSISSDEVSFAAKSSRDLMLEVSELNGRLSRCMEELKVQRRS